MRELSEKFSSPAQAALLAGYFAQIDSVILSRQNPLTGLLPASTAVNAHGDYTDAWVRDNVYSILSVWGLGLAYRRQGGDSARAYLLEQSVVKLMRGLLTAMMKQADKVERFKQTQHPVDALHAKYDTHTGDAVVGDADWGHLQIDATSLYLLMLAQMIASGLRIIFSLDEVNFIQNLVHYIGRAYRAPDYGIWERGNKLNHGLAELNMSSVGMAKAALEAMDGFNLFGKDGAQSSVVHVVSDEIARARSTLDYMLPRESGSKEVDAALLSVIGYPAYAVEDPYLVETTRNTIIDKLSGRYGCKRFLRDGHQTALEDTSRLHYEPTELKQFKHIESEWPLFFTYLMLDGLCRGDHAQAQEYAAKLETLCVEVNGQRLLPELYYVDAAHIEAEKARPHSQPRLPNENIPLVWAQSLYLLGQLLRDELIVLDDIDPLRRHARVGQQRHSQVLIALLVDDSGTHDYLASRGIESELLSDIRPVRVHQADDLAEAYCQLGRNKKLGLSGRPMRRLRALSTSRVFMLSGSTMLFLPQILNLRDFYLGLDSSFLAQRLRSELVYIHRHWNQSNKPLMTLLIGRDRLHQEDESDLITLLSELQTGDCGGVPTRVGKLRDLLPEAGTERIDYLHDFTLSADRAATPILLGMLLPSRDQPDRGTSLEDRLQLELANDAASLCEQLKQTQNMDAYMDILARLWTLEGGSYDTGIDIGSDASLRSLTENLYITAGRTKRWAVVRRAAALLEKSDESLGDAVVEIVIRQKQLAIGRAYSLDAVISEPMSNTDLLDKIRTYCGDDLREHILHQELVIYLAMLIKAEPALFEDMLTLRIGHMLQLIVAQQARIHHWPQHTAFEYVLTLSPHTLTTELREVLAGYRHMVDNITRVEALHSVQRSGEIAWVRFPALDNPTLASADPDWNQWRESHGVVSRLPKDFFSGVWGILKHCHGIVIGDRFDPRNSLDSALLQGEMTSGEKNFVLRVEHLLNKSKAPSYQQLVIEALHALRVILKANPTLAINGYIIVDVLIGHAVRLAWLDLHPEQEGIYNESRGAAWASFYASPPHQAANAFMAAFAFLLEQGSETDTAEDFDTD
jgi:phosphorylase kinase alpha/beta subunit